MGYPFMSVEDQKKLERLRIEEAKAGVKPRDPVHTPQPAPLAVPALDIDIKSLLEGLDLHAIARENGFWKESYEKLGPGQLRMTIGNVLRGRIKKNMPVTINGEKIGTSS